MKPLEIRLAPFEITMSQEDLDRFDRLLKNAAADLTRAFQQMIPIITASTKALRPWEF